MTPEALHGYLTKVDPESAAEIHPNNVKRVIRAIEVYETMGEPLSVMKHKRAARCSFRVKESHFLNPPREQLYTTIDKRTEQMYKNGLVAETQALLKRYLPSTPALNSIGYRECREYLSGTVSIEESIRKTAQMTRNYAKRQITWFKNKKYC
jgi:tRNA dimethylallyltransferase